MFESTEVDPGTTAAVAERHLDRPEWHLVDGPPRTSDL